MYLDREDREELQLGLDSAGIQHLWVGKDSGQQVDTLDQRDILVELGVWQAFREPVEPTDHLGCMAEILIVQGKEDTLVH